MPHTSKSHQNIVGTQANYESTKYSDEKSKSNKVLRTTAKLMHELLPDRKKVMETLRARRMIRLLPERYDLNRPLVWKAFPMQLRWSTRSLGFSRQRCLDCLDWRKNARVPVAEHASDEGKTPCTCLTRYASGLSLFDIPLRHCSCPKVWSQSVASKTWQHTDSSGWLIGVSIIPTDPFAVHPVHWCRTC